MNFEENYKKYLEIFNKNLNLFFDNLDYSSPKIITDAIQYAVKDGGKRIRPVLTLACANMLKVDFKEVLPYAIAIELIHSYSLVHDDLPAMDNDDFRRGKLSTHKKFGEAYGILAGDALLNLAFEVIFSKEKFSESDLNACKILSEFAGYRGMIGGQVLDLESEKKNLSLENLYEIYNKKTSKLITAPLLIASCFKNYEYFDKLKEYGYNLGILFQITDDIMDEEGDLSTIGKTPHKDKDEDKFTSVKIFGLAGAKTTAKQHYDKCKGILSEIENSQFLQEFTDKIYIRKS